MKILNKILFTGILLLAVFLRIWNLGNIPISLNWDEVAIGYNAYSILKTGMDEHGVRFPIVLESFGDFKPALYSYLLVPVLMVFDLGSFAVRLPSAVFGIIGVIFSYFLTKELLKLRGNYKNAPIVSLTVMFLLAVSPWHIQFSRAAFEANIATTFFIIGFWAFLLGLKRPIFLFLSAASLGFSLHAYHSTRLFVPLFLLFLIFIFRENLLAYGKKLLTPAIIGFLFLIPFFYFALTGRAEMIFGRASQTTVFSNSKSLNEAVYKIGEGYLKHVSLKWLFVTGDNDRHHAPSSGILYIWELPFFILGILILLRDKSKFKLVILSWILLGLVPSSLTTEVPHAIRTLILIPSLQIITALGVVKVALTVWKKKILLLPAFFYILFIGFGFILYFHLYFYQMNHEYSRFWQFGYSDAVSYVRQNDQKYKKIVVSNKLEQPYIFFLFFLRYDPKLYLSEGGTRKTKEQAFGKYEFRNINWKEEVHDGSVLNILSPSDERSEPIHTIRYFDGGDAFIIAE
ncbi:MAG: glycosyltransferase family 39 protein [Candidatus Levybacteria bacterium]|nr:glycosyltransferase family 39 protein [Candidatus Levybacteria bacterium]